MSEFNAQRKAQIRKAVTARPGYVAGKMTLQPGFLAIAVLLVNGQGTYRFNHKSSKGLATPFERLLNENDAFVCTDMGMFLVAENPAEPGTGVLQTAPSQFNFPAQAGQLNPAHLEAFYSPAASLSLKVDDKTYAEGIPTWPSRVVGTDQATEHRAIAGLFPLEPTITIDGSKKTDLVLTVPTFTNSKVQYSDAAGVSDPNPKRVYAVLYFDGYQITGGSNLGNLSAE